MLTYWWQKHPAVWDFQGKNSDDISSDDILRGTNKLDISEDHTPNNISIRNLESSGPSILNR